MKTYQIKVIKSNPIHKQNVILSIDSFKQNYPGLWDVGGTDEYNIDFIVKNLIGWFRVNIIEVNNFNVGD